MGIMKPEFKISEGKLFINGKWKASGKKFATINPATEDVIAYVAEGTATDVDEAATAAHDAFHEGPWGKMAGSERAKIMHKIADLIEQRGDELAYRESIDMGMLYRDSQGWGIPHIANLFRYYAGWATKIEGSVKPAEGVGYRKELMAYTLREPLGVVAAITPFNFPLILSVSKIAPAFAAGNTFIHKPASSTPLAAITLAEIMQEAGVADGAYNMITGPGGVIGAAITKHPLIDKVAITGSTTTGQQIIRDGADTMKHITVELGGKSPHIIFADADMEAAVTWAFYGIFLNKGEVCVAGSRLLVERPIYAEFVARLAERVGNMKVGDPFDPANDYGPMADAKEHAKVMRYIKTGIDEGARLVTGGNAFTIGGKGFYIAPTIFADATNEMKISREEIFGPVVPIIPFDGFDDAIRMANDTPYGLAAGVQTKDAAKAMRAARRINAGTVWLNTWHQYDPSVPFGGYKMSGYGREQGPEALASYTQTKSVWLELGG